MGEHFSSKIKWCVKYFFFILHLGSCYLIFQRFKFGGYQKNELFLFCLWSIFGLFCIRLNLQLKAEVTKKIIFIFFLIWVSIWFSLFHFQKFSILLLLSDLLKLYFYFKHYSWPFISYLFKSCNLINQFYTVL